MIITIEVPDHELPEIEDWLMRQTTLIQAGFEFADLAFINLARVWDAARVTETIDRQKGDQ